MGEIGKREKGKKGGRNLRFLLWTGMRTTPTTEIKEIPTTESIPYNQASPVEISPLKK